MDDANKFKVVFTAVMTALSAWLGALALPVILLLVANITDYITGLLAAKYREVKINSYTSIRGIMKKVCMWLLILVGVMLDAILMYATETLGIQLPVGFLVGCLVAVWLIVNELISILENIKDIGVKMPTFLLKLTKNIQTKVEEVTGEEGEDDGTET